MEKDCWNCKKLDDFSDDCDECMTSETPSKWEPGDIFVPDTIADCIRRMDDRTLAKAIREIASGNDELSQLYCHGDMGCVTGDGEIVCDEASEEACILKWLQQPAPDAPAPYDLSEISEE